MNFDELLYKRRSVRCFKEDKVESDKLKEVLASAKFAPSSMNQQSWHFIVIDNKDIIKQISEVLGDKDEKPFYGAPCLIIALGKKDNIAPVVDTSLAMCYMMLKASDIGLATCWIHRVKLIVNDTKYETMKKALNISDEYLSIGALALGYSGEDNKVMRKIKEDYCTFVQ